MNVKFYVNDRKGRLLEIVGGYGCERCDLRCDKCFGNKSNLDTDPKDWPCNEFARKIDRKIGSHIVGDYGVNFHLRFVKPYDISIFRNDHKEIHQYRENLRKAETEAALRNIKKGGVK